MKGFKRLAQVFTPLPKKRKSVPQPAPESTTPPPAPSITFVELKPLVRKLVRAASSDDPETAKLRAELMAKAHEGDIYLIASALHAYVSGMKASSDEDRVLRKEAGLDVAGELFYIHMRREIDSIGSRPHPMGPSIFKTLCNEFFDCYISGPQYGKALAYGFSLMDYLLERAASSVKHRKPLLELAEQAVRSMIEITTRKFDNLGGEAIQLARMRQQGIETDKEDGMLDRGVFAYLEDTYKRVAYICDEIQKVESPAGDPNADAQSRKAWLAYLYRLLQVAQHAQYGGFTARLKELIGLRLRAGRQESARDFLVAAAQDLETQAEGEQDTGLLDLARMRQSKAGQLRTLVNADQRAERGQPPRETP